MRIDFSIFFCKFFLDLFRKLIKSQGMKIFSPKNQFLFACLIFFMFGVFQASLGPILGDLADRTNSSLSIIGGVLTFLFSGSLVSQLISGPIIDEIGKKYVIAISLFLLGLSILGFSSSHSLTWVFIFFFVAGIGQGGIDVGTNLVVVDSFFDENTRYLNIMHFLFGMGALTGPALVGLANHQSLSGLIVLIYSAAVLLFLGLTSLFLIKDIPKNSSSEEAKNNNREKTISIYRSPILWLIGLVMLLYIGVEYSVGSWISDFTKISISSTFQIGAIITSVYWGSLALGRLAGSLLSRYLSNLIILLLALSSSLLGVLGLMINLNNIIPLCLFVLWIGFSYGTVIPTTVALASSHFQKSKGKAIGILSAMGSVGGLSLPWVAGMMIGGKLLLAYEFFVFSLICIIIILLIFLYKMIPKTK